MGIHAINQKLMQAQFPEGKMDPANPPILLLDRSGPNRRSETVAHNEQFAPFFVEDPSGRVAVNAEGAGVDAKQVVAGMGHRSLSVVSL